MLNGNKRVFCLLSAFLLLAGMAGCGSSEPSEHTESVIHVGVSDRAFYGKFSPFFTESVGDQTATELTQLRLLDDISYQLYSNAANFVSDAGIDEQTFIAALDAIYDRIEKANTGSNQTARSVQQNTLTTIENTRRTVDSLYAQNSQALKSGGDQ